MGRWVDGRMSSGQMDGWIGVIGRRVGGWDNGWEGEWVDGSMGR